MSGIHEIKGASTLPTGAKERKECPIASGVLDYFPRAIAAIAQVSFKGNEQHNPGTPLHWDRSKSSDEADALMRHFLERGTLDSDGQRHSAKVAWRALALLEKEIEKERKSETTFGPGSVVKMHFGTIDLKDRSEHIITGSCNVADRSYRCSCGGRWLLNYGEFWHQYSVQSMAPRPGGAF